MTHMLLMIGTSELLLIAALVLLLFGGKKLPEMMRGLGQGVRSFKDGMREGETSDGGKPQEAQPKRTPEQPASPKTETSTFKKENNGQQSE